MPTPRSLAATLALLLCGTPEVAAQDAKPAPPVKADSAPRDAAKGALPPNWKKLGLSDAQRDKVTAIAGRYSVEIDELESRIADLKAKRQREQLAVLSAEQKKALEDIYKRKAGTDK